MPNTSAPTAPRGTSYANLFASLKKQGAEYVGATSKGGLWRCPIHDDANASFEVNEGRKGIPLVSCPPCEARLGDHTEFMDELRFAGVQMSGRSLNEGEEVDWGELSAPSHGGGSHSGGAKGSLLDTHSLVATYEYKHADGTSNFQVRRWEPRDTTPGLRKVFTPSHYELGKGRVRGLEGVKRTPYHLEDFERWQGRAVYLVEGEKAADALIAAKRPATTFHGGCKKEPDEGWVERYGFDKFREVRVWPDADEVGVAWARRRAADLEAAGVSVRFFGVPAGDVEPEDDAFDVLKRKEAALVRALRDEEVDDLAARKPAQSAPRVEIVTSPKGYKQGIEIVTPKSAGGSGGGSAGTGVSPEGRPVLSGGRDIYPMTVTLEPYRFAAEMVSRHFMDDDGVHTLRWHSSEQAFWTWDYSKVCYVRLSMDAARAAVETILQNSSETTNDDKVRPVNVKPRTVTDVLEGIKRYTLVGNVGDLQTPEGGVPFLNGWLDLASGELKTLGPFLDVRWTVPAKYKENAECPEWMKFLDSVGKGVGTEDYRLLAQWFGYLLSGEMSHHKAFLMVGPKRCGKGTILNIAEALFGGVGPYCGAVAASLANFNPERTFGLSAFVGKGLATFGDVRWGKNDAGRNAQLLQWTGGDSIPVDVKFAQPISVKPTARLFMASNESPRFFEASDALAARFVLMEFTESFYDREDLGLAARLRKELPGIAKWALDGYRDFVKVGHFSETARGVEMKSQVAFDSSPVRAFVEECCALEETAETEFMALFYAYQAWRNGNGFAGVSSPEFGRELRSSYPDLVELRPRVAGKSARPRVRKGIKLLPAGSVY